MGKFVIKRATGGFTFSFVGSDEKIIGSSEVYTSKTSTKGGIESVKKNVGAVVEDQTQKDCKVEKTPKWEIFKDKAGGFRFRLMATNGKNVIHTSAFKTLAAANEGLAAIKKTAKAASIVDESAAEKKPVAKKPAEKKPAAKKPAAKATAKKPAAKKPAAKATAKKAVAKKPVAKKPAAKTTAKKTAAKKTTAKK